MPLGVVETSTCIVLQGTRGDCLDCSIEGILFRIIVHDAHHCTLVYAWNFYLTNLALVPNVVNDCPRIQTLARPAPTNSDLSFRFLARSQQDPEKK